MHYSQNIAHSAFVHFKKKSEAAKALRELDFYEIKSSQIRVKWIDDESEEEDNLYGRLIRKSLPESRKYQRTLLFNKSSFWVCLHTAYVSKETWF